jgi:hypothetical protein
MVVNITLIVELFCQVTSRPVVTGNQLPFIADEQECCAAIFELP